MKIQFGAEEQMALTIWLGFMSGIVYGVGWANSIPILGFFGLCATFCCFVLLNEIYKVVDYDNERRSVGTDGRVGS